MSTGSLIAGAKGAPPSSRGSMPRKMWCMMVLPTTTRSTTSSGASPALGGRVLDQPVERLDHGVVQHGQAVRVLHDVGDARHQIFAVADLRVHAAFGGQQPAGAQLTQVRHHGRRAHVHRHAVGQLLVAGLDAQHFLVLPDGGGYAVHQAGHRRAGSGRPASAGWRLGRIAKSIRRRSRSRPKRAASSSASRAQSLRSSSRLAGGSST